MTKDYEEEFLLDEEFIKVIEKIYASKYLEANGTVAS